MIDDRQKARSNRSATRTALLMIVVGVITLLVEQFGNLPDLPLQLRMFPVVLIILGVALLLSRVSRVLTMLLVFLTAIGIIAFLVFGRSLGLTDSADLLAQSFSEPVGNATSADVSLDVGALDLIVKPLADPTLLLTTNVGLGSSLDYQTSGGAQRQLSVKDSNDGFSVLTDLLQSGPKTWEVDVNPSVPVNLHADSNTSAVNLSLSQLDLSGLSVDSNTGAVSLALPSTGALYTATISTGSGDVTVTIPDGAAVNLNVSTGAGNTMIDVPDDAAVQVTAAGAGTVDILAFLRPLKSSAIPGNGTWQSASFAGAQRQIVISFQTGGGKLTIR